MRSHEYRSGEALTRKENTLVGIVGEEHQVSLGRNLEGIWGGLCMPLKRSEVETGGVKKASGHSP